MNLVQKYDEFMESDVRNQWINDGDFEIYLRKSRRLVSRFGRIVTTVDIANIGRMGKEALAASINIRMNPKPTGKFREFLQHVIETCPMEAVYIENVFSPRLQEILRKHNWVDVTDAEWGNVPSFAMLLDEVECEDDD